MRFFFINIFIVNLLFGALKIHILKINNDTAIINKANLQIGQSGVIVHKFLDNNEIILAKGIVISSNKHNSTIKLLKNDLLLQNAIPTTNLKPSTKDYFILNHLYHNALIIAPNYQSYQTLKQNFNNIYFINPDYFAAYLKIEQNPAPDKKDFIFFCKDNQIGVIFFIIQNKFYMVDGISFKIIFSAKINNTNKTNLPFYTNVKEIKGGIFNFDKITNYNKYFKNLLEIK
jgi:hypothetical protein